MATVGPAAGTRESAPPGAGEGAPPGVLDLYRALASAARDVLARRSVAIAVEVGLLVAWLVIRSTTPADGPLYLAWAVAVGVLTLLRPVSGLVILAAIAPFDEPYTVSRVLGLKHVLVAVLAASVAIRLAVRPRSLPASWALLGAGGVALGTLAGLVLTFRRYDSEFAADSAQLWLAGVGGGMLILIAAAWIARDGELRPLVAATAAGVVAAAVSLADYLAPGFISGGSLEWMVHAKDFGFRISGVIPSPNGLAALLLPPAMLLAAVVIFFPRWRLRALALAGLAPLVPALYFTYSRTVFLAVFGFAVIAAWRIRRWLGVLVLAAGLVVGAFALPAYLQLRAGVTGVAVTPGTVLVASDEARFVAWGAAAGMWRDEPLTGHGFRSYKLVGDEYGDRVLNSPHNEWLRLFAEEGALVGLVGLGFILATLGRLGRVPGWLGAGTMAGFLAYVLAASFNNPFLFIQVSLVAFTIVGTGLAWSRRWPGTAEEPVSAEEPGTVGEAASAEEPEPGTAEEPEPATAEEPEPATAEELVTAEEPGTAEEPATAEEPDTAEPAAATVDDPGSAAADDPGSAAADHPDSATDEEREPATAEEPAADP
jgi:O-antigen ligase